MRMRKMLIVIALLLTALMFQQLEAADLFENEEGGLLTVTNETDADIVLFAGRLENGIVLGGVRAMGSRSFDISKIEKLPQEGAFIIRGVLAKAYEQKPDLRSASDVLYSSLVVYDLNSKNKTAKTIPREIDDTMSYSFTASNNSRDICELRLNNPDGQRLAVLSPGERYRQLWIKPSDFGQPVVLFPAFIGYIDGEVNVRTPSIDRGIRFIPQPPGDNMMVVQFENQDAFDASVNLLFE